MKQLLSLYSSSAIAVDLPIQSIQDVLSLEEAFWKTKNSQHTLKNTIIRHHLKKQRSDEEISMIENEMQTVIDYFSKKAQSISSTLNESNYEKGQFRTGSVSILKKLLLETQIHMQQATTAFTSLGLTLDIERSTLIGLIEIDLSDDEIDTMSSSSDLEDY